MSDDRVVMPGDADESAEKLRAERTKKAAAAKKAAEPRERPEDPQPDHGKDDAKRGILSPVQHDDDGWGDTPVQMRGE